MAENKKTFISYCEWQEIFNALSDVKAGKLIKHLFAYVNDENPKTDDKYVNLAFISIKQNLKRDLKKYEVYIVKQKENGLKGGRPKKPKKTQITQAFILKPKKADNVNVNVIDISIYYKSEECFLKDWKKVRENILAQPTNIKKLSQDESDNFKQLQKEFTIQEFRNAIQGLFKQKQIFKANILRPRHFLQDRNIEKYLDAFTNKTQLYAKEEARL